MDALTQIPVKDGSGAPGGEAALVDLSTFGRRGVAACWRTGPATGVVGLVQVRGKRVLARLGFLDGTRGLDPHGMARAALFPRQDDGLILAAGPEAGENALVFAMGQDVPALARIADAGHVPGLAARIADPAAIARAFGPDAEAVLLAAVHGLTPDAAGALLDASPSGPALRALLAAHPMAVGAALSSAKVLKALSKGAEPHVAFGEACPGYTPGHLRRCRGVGVEVFDPLLRNPGRRSRRVAAARTMALCAALPPDWVPAADGWVDLGIVAMALDAGYALDQGCLATSRGDWGGTVSRIRRLLGLPADASAHETLTRAEHAARNVGDVGAALSVQLILPLAAWGRRAAGLPVELGGPGDLELPCLAAARELLFVGRGLVSCLEVSQRWHRHRDELARGFMSASRDLSWPVPFPPFEHETADGVVEVVPIGDALSLYEEGSAGTDRRGAEGLDHCVFGRLGAALRGDAHVLSLRLRLPGGGYRRLSTAQVELDGLGFTVDEHEARNGEPGPAACEDALAALRVMYADVPLDVMPRQGGRPDPVRDACGYDWTDEAALSRALAAWSPFLPRWLRGLAPAEALAALAAHGVLAMPGAGAPLLAA